MIAAGPGKPSRLAGGRPTALGIEVARDLEAPAEALLRLALDDNLWVRRQAAAHPAFPADELELLRRAGSSADLASFAPPDATLPAEGLARLAERGEWGRRLAARHPATPAQTLLELGEHPSASLRADLAANPGSPSALVVHLLADSDPAVRQAAVRGALSEPGPGVHGGSSTVAEALALLLSAGASSDLAAAGAPSGRLAPAERAALLALGPFAHRLAAGLPDLAPQEINLLAEDRDSATRAVLAGNLACPETLLLRLAEDDDPAVQQAVLGNPRAPPEALLALAADEEDTERLVALASHPAAPADLLARLAEHGAGRVREAAAAHARFPQRHRELLRRAGATRDLLAFAEPDPDLPTPELTRLARSGTWGRLLAARHPATSPEDLARLAADSDLLVRQAAARHPRLPSEVLDLLVQAGSTRELDGFERLTVAAPPAASGLARLAGLGPWGRRLTARHPACPTGLLADLASDSDPQVRVAVAAHQRSDGPSLTALAQDISPAVRWEVVKHRDLAGTLLAALARDPLATIRAVVAAHPSTPPEILEALARDPDEDVRAAARLRIPLRA